MAYERLIPGSKYWDLYYANHLSRYQFAFSYLKQTKSQKVLDAATGVGYGANYLAKNGISQVMGIDRNEDALRIANQNFKTAGLSFLMDDCETMSACQSQFPFDAVVSFETLEHLPNPHLFLKNCFNALHAGGLFIVSTPNQIVSSPDGLTWDYHEKEYTPSELREILLSEGFQDVRIYGQQYTVLGKLRADVRHHLNVLEANPFVKIGQWIQKTFRGRRFKTILPEKLEDFEIVEYPNPEDITAKGLDGPIVLIAVCSKQPSK